jgi:hypothetical protein
MDTTSVVFDPVATNDFLISDLYTISEGMHGSACMAKALIKGDGTGIGMRVIDENNDIFDSIELVNNTIAGWVHLYFTCPTAADIAGDAKKGNLRISFYQIDTDAGPIEIDDTYLGLYTAENMVVQGGEGILSWTFEVGSPESLGGTFDYNLETNSPTYSSGNTELFNIIGEKIYPTEKIMLSIVYNGGKTDNGAYNRGLLRCMNPDGQAFSEQDLVIDSASGTVGNYMSAAKTVLVSPDQYCYVTKASAGNSNVPINITLTAQPLPQIATIVPATQKRAGFLASKEWAPTAGCVWSRTSSIFGTYPLDTDCDNNPRTFEGI